MNEDYKPEDRFGWNRMVEIDQYAKNSSNKRAAGHYKLNVDLIGNIRRAVGK